MIGTIRDLWAHAIWADQRLLAALDAQHPVPPAAVRELLHVLGTEENWLARIEQRSPRAAIWPDGTLEDASRLLGDTHAAVSSYLETLDDRRLSRVVDYRNSAGDRFRNSVREILVHVALHGQYHRGKINLLLRDAGLEPEWCDYIAFVRGAPAATEATSRR